MDKHKNLRNRTDSSLDISNLHTPRITPGVTPEDITVVLRELYGLEATKHPSEIGGYWDFNFHVLTPAGAVLCKVYTHDSHRDAEFHADLMNTLSREGLPVSEVLRTREEQTVCSVASMPCIVQRWLPGVSMSELPITNERIYELGETLAQIHNASDGRRFAGSQTKITSWDPRQWELLFDRYEASVHRFSPYARKHLDVLHRKTLFLRDELNSLPQGIIHGDYHPGNVLGFKEGISGVVDFSEATHSWIVGDLGICLSYLMEEQETRFHRAAHFLTGYCQEAPLARTELALLPIMIQLRAATRAIESKLDGGVAERSEIELIEYFNQDLVEAKWLRVFCS
jgi:Ser/Thr protein kinase RdoA (MazF antagonist)